MIDLSNMLGEVDVVQRLDENPCILTRRWPAMLYWLGYVTNCYSNPDNNVIPERHILYSAVSVSCNFAVALMNCGVDAVQTLILNDIGFFTLIARIWLEQDLRFNTSWKNEKSSPGDARAKLALWSSEYSPFPSTALVMLIRSEPTNEDSALDFKNRLLVASGGNYEFIAETAIRRVKCILRLYSLDATTKEIDERHSQVAELRPYELRIYVLLLAHLHTEYTELSAAFIKRKSAFVLADAARQVLDILSCEEPCPPDRLPYEMADEILAPILHALSSITLSGRNGSRQTVQSGILEIIARTYATFRGCTGERENGRVPIVIKDTSADIRVRRLLVRDLPRFMHYPSVLSGVVKAITKSTSFPTRMDRIVGQELPLSMKAFVTFTIERAICKALFEREAASEKRLCSNVRLSSV